jgi:hypothetical protein
VGWLAGLARWAVACWWFLLFFSASYSFSIFCFAVLSFQFDLQICFAGIFESRNYFEIELIYY